MPRKSYYDKNKEKCRASALEYYYDHQETVLENRANHAESHRDYCKEWYMKQPHEYKMWKASRNSARSRGFNHNIEPSDIVIPTHCPILGIELKPGENARRSHSPSLDRIDNSRGYVKGNVWVISCKANTMKSDATPEELRRFSEWAIKH